MDSLLMSMKDSELLRFHTVKSVVDKRLGTSEAAKLLKLSQRQVQRLVARFLKHGPIVFVSKKRAKRSNRALPVALKQEALSIIRKDYYDFGPTLAAEKLLERNGINISNETARQWMVEAGIWREKQKREPVVHPPRLRRGCFGELIQLDGSEHAWFEDRGLRCTLLVFIDDATSTIMLLRFVKCESTINYFKAMKDYFLKHGKPRNFYTDKHVVFKINYPNTKTGNGLTQYTRALSALGIAPIYAHTPQAKGRVERANSTLQDRLVKELRLRDISTIEDANNFLEEYRKDHNKRFAKPPRSEFNAHIPLSQSERDNLDVICSVQIERTISKDMLVRFNNILIKIIAPGQVHRLAGEKVFVCEDTQGRTTILHNNKPLHFEVYNKIFKDGHILSAKEINSALDEQMHKWKPVINSDKKTNDEVIQPKREKDPLI